ncbi:hypothetical protein C8F04DRAFT_1099502 [Mycena alexandri]|uniref:HMG box domain-containing protein n=1 Tax=Mycena alexandri TaxID=1745969 RepID=A0AAD6SWW2_9AGAR|nr:hypothetical protein C8F04DRAFT_1099502 [Mycena alexandri]
MPAERSRYSRRSQADGSAIVWTLPVEPLGDSGIGFAPNLTEDTFADLPPLVEAPDAPLSPCESFIFANDDPGSAPIRRSTHTRKKSDNHIPRPPNAFILFRSSFIKSQRVSTEVETNHSTLSKIIGMTWKNLPPGERGVWQAKAMDAVAEHKRNFPTYAFRPKHSRSKNDPDGPPPKAKRKVREVYQDPRRCEKIAELLVEGKKGAELDRAIQEFDKYHVPEIITRFEAPMTARAYRRSSSVPVPNSDDSRGFLSSSQSPSANSSRRRRSSSVGAATRASQAEGKPKVRSASIYTGTDSTGCSDGQLTPPSFDSFSFQHQSKEEPDLDTFDFSSFSFSNVTSPSPSFGCDPLLMPPCSPLETSFDHKLEPSSPADYTPVEPMDISAFIANEWLQHGDSANPFSNYPPVDYSIPAFAFPVPVYSQMQTVDSTTFCSDFKNLGFEGQQQQQPYCAQPQNGAGFAQLEADLASFMSQYSL